MKFGPVFALVLMAVWAGSAVAQKGQRIQCWTDKNGHRMCGDNIPPEYAGQTREIYEEGRVVETKKPAKTAAEIAAEIAEEKRAAEAVEAVQKQAAYDRDLIQTYRSAKDLEAMRDERLALIDSRIASAQKGSEDTDKSLADLRARADALTKSSKPVDDKLGKQIKQYEKAHEQNLLVLERAKKERVDVETKFNTDIARYNLLRGIKEPPAVAKPAPAAARSAPVADPAAKDKDKAISSAAPAPAPGSAPEPAKK